MVVNFYILQFETQLSTLVILNETGIIKSASVITKTEVLTDHDSVASESNWCRAVLEKNSNRKSCFKLSNRHCHNALSIE